MRGTWAAAGLMLLASACSPGRAVKTALLDVSAEEVVARAHQAASTAHTSLRMEATLSVRTPARAASARASLVHRRGDSLYVTLTATALRIPVGRLWATPDSFYYHDRLAGQVIFGPIAWLDLLVPGLMADADAFTRLLALEVPDAGARWKVAGEDTHVLLSNSAFRYRIDAETWRVIQVESLAASGTVVQSTRYSDFEPLAGLRIPTRLHLQRPEQGIVLALTYRDVMLDSEPLDFSATPPRDVPWVQAEEAFSGFVHQ